MLSKHWCEMPLRALEESMGNLPQIDQHEALAKALGSAHMLRKNSTAMKYDNPNVTLLQMLH